MSRPVSHNNRSIKPVLKKVIRAPSYVWALIVLAFLLVITTFTTALDLATCVVVLDLRTCVAKLDLTQINIFAILGISLAVVPTIELIRTHRLQRSELVRNHVSAFLANKEITNAYYDLIYNYDENNWKAVKWVLESAGLNTATKAPPGKTVISTPEERARCWQALKPLNDGKRVGSRLYHPKFFQGSLEERRLDALLNYFDIVAYNFANGLIDIRDLDGVSSNYLATIGTRPVFNAYIDLLKNGWSKLPQSKDMGAPVPFRHLSALLAELQKHNKSQPQSDPRDNASEEAKDGTV